MWSELSGLLAKQPNIFVKLCTSSFLANNLSVWYKLGKISSTSKKTLEIKTIVRGSFINRNYFTTSDIVRKVYQRHFTFYRILKEIDIRKTNKDKESLSFYCCTKFKTTLSNLVVFDNLSFKSTRMV